MLKIFILFSLSFGNLLYAENFNNSNEKKTFFITENGNGNGNGLDVYNSISVKKHNNQVFPPGSLLYLSGNIYTPILINSSGTEKNYIIYDGNISTFNMKNAEIIGKNTYNSHAIKIINKNYLIIKNIKIKNFSSGITIQEQSHDIIIKKCIISDNLRTGINISSLPKRYGGSGIGNYAILIKNNKIYNIGTGTGGGDIIISHSNDINISYNHLFATSDKALGLKSDRGIDGIVLLQTHNVIIEYNNIHGHNDSYFNDEYNCVKKACIGLGEDGIDLKHDNQNIIVRFNNIYDHKYQTGITVQYGTNNSKIYNNKIYNNLWSGILIKDGAYGWNKSVKNIEIYNNYIYTNYQSGIKIVGTYPEPTNINIHNNLIAKNACDLTNTKHASFRSLSGLYISSGSGHSITNNIFYKNRPNQLDYRQFYIGNGSESDIEFNNNILYWPNQKVHFYWGNMNKDYTTNNSIFPKGVLIEENPLFLNPQKNNFKLKSTSLFYNKNIGPAPIK